MLGRGLRVWSGLPNKIGCRCLRAVCFLRALYAWFGQIYVLVSRCTQPDDFELIGGRSEIHMRIVILAVAVPRTGVPPFDLVEDVHKALRAAGWDPDEIFSLSTTIGGEWNYDPCRPYEHRFYQKRMSERTVPMVRRTLEESLSIA